MSVNGYTKLDLKDVQVSTNGYKLSKRNATQEYPIVFNVLQSILRNNNVPKQYYSIGSYAENSICIEKRNRSWIVYGGERGMKHDVKKYNHSVLACYDLLERVTCKEDSKKIIAKFTEELERLNKIRLQCTSIDNNQKITTFV